MSNKKSSRTKAQLLAALMCLGLSACASVSKIPMPGIFAHYSDQKSGRAVIEKAVSNTDIDRSDIIALERAISGTLSEVGDGESVDWSNDETGTNGIVQPHTVYRNDDQGLCRDFSTTVSSLAGIQRYSGTACRSDENSWALEILENFSDDTNQSSAS